jgi:hypothetical protein
MNMKTIRSFAVIVIRTAILALLVVGFSPGQSRAQEVPLKFTLPFEARWGPAILSAGEYSLSTQSGSLWGFVIIRREPRGDVVALIRPDSSEQVNLPDNSKLVVECRGEKAIVRAMYIEDKRLIFRYASHVAKDQIFSPRAKPVRQTLLLAAAN